MPMQDEVVGVCRRTNAANAMATVTGLFSVRPEAEHVDDEEVVVDTVDVEEEEMLEPVEVDQELVRFRLLL